MGIGGMMGGGCARGLRGGFSFASTPYSIEAVTRYCEHSYDALHPDLTPSSAFLVCLLPLLPLLFLQNNPFTTVPNRAFAGMGKTLTKLYLDYSAGA